MDPNDGHWKGVKRSQEFKDTVRRTLKRLYQNGHPHWNTGRELSEEHKQAVSRGGMGRHSHKLTPEARERISKSLKEYYSKMNMITSNQEVKVNVVVYESEYNLFLSKVKGPLEI